MARQDDIRAVSKLIREANSILFITGAGVSAESGLPTYRGVGGLYHDADTPEGIPIEVALSGQMWRTRPEITWRHILDIERACRGASPNAAHEAIARLEREKERVWVLTQNVDGLHHKAGSENLITIHGDLRRLFCPSCGWEEHVEDYAHLSGHEPAPTCPTCQSVIRPDIILFGEQLPPKQVALYDTQIEQLGFDLVFSVGTTSQFPYIAHPVLAAARTQRPTVEINPNATPVSQAVTYTFRETCGALLTTLVDEALDQP